MKRGERQFFYWGDMIRQIPQLEKLREVQAFCSHDLRSQIAATVGLLRILADDPQSSSLKNHKEFQAALKSAEDALKALDDKVQTLSLGYKVGWILSSEEPPGGTSESPVSNTSRLFVRFAASSDLVSAFSHYRPTALFLSARLAGDQLLPLIQRAGPQMVKIFVYDAPENLALPPGVSATSQARPSWAQIHQAWDNDFF